MSGKDDEHVLWVIHPSHHYIDDYVRTEFTEMMEGLKSSFHAKRRGRPIEGIYRPILQTFEDITKADPRLKLEFVNAFSDVIASTHTHDFDVDAKEAVERLKGLYQRLGKPLPDYFERILKKPELRPIKLSETVFNSIAESIAHAQKSNRKVVVELEEGGHEEFRRHIDEFNNKPENRDKIDNSQIRFFEFTGLPSNIHHHVRSVAKFLEKIGKPSVGKKSVVHLMGFLGPECVAMRALILKNIKNLQRQGIPLDWETKSAPEAKIVYGFPTPVYAPQSMVLEKQVPIPRYGEPEIEELTRTIDLTKLKSSPRSQAYLEKPGLEFWEMVTNDWIEKLNGASHKDEQLRTLINLGIFRPGTTIRDYELNWNSVGLHNTHGKNMFETKEMFKRRVGPRA